MDYCFKDLTATCQQEWRHYIEHDFVRALGAGTLDQNAFRCYLQQDYLFLIHFARAYALAAYKSRTLSDLRQAQGGPFDHPRCGTRPPYCLLPRMGYFGKPIWKHCPRPARHWPIPAMCSRAGHRGDLLDLHVALAPCLSRLRRNRLLAQ